MPLLRLAGLCVVILAAPRPASAQPVSAIVTPPATNALPGDDVTLCVQITGTPPFTLQWQKNGFNLPSATNACLTLTNLVTADGGGYRVLVRHPFASVVSSPAEVEVTASITPGGLTFASRTEVFALNNNVQGDNTGAGREPGEPSHAGLSGSNSVWYSWTAPIAGIATFDTQGSDFDTVLAVYTGTGFELLTEIASDDDSGGFHTSRVQWNAEAGVTYQIAIDSLAGEQGTYFCNWALEITEERIPRILAQPSSQTVPEGGLASFSVVLTNTNPQLSYQWYRNGQPLLYATSLNLTVRNVGTVHLGEYVLEIREGELVRGRTVPAYLEIGPVPDVQSQDKVGLLNLNAGGGSGGAGGAGGAAVGGFFSLANGTTINQRFVSAGSQDRCEPPHCGVAGGASRWFQLVAEEDGLCTIDTAGSDVDTVLAVYLQNFGICTNLFEPVVGCNNDFLGSCANLASPQSRADRSSRFSFFVPQGSVYRAVVDTVNGIPGTNVHFNVSMQPVNPAPKTELVLNATPISRLQRLGSRLTLRVDQSLIQPGQTYTWKVDGRIRAGATHSALILPESNYSDAGHYSVSLGNPQSGDRTDLPGLDLVVVEPCTTTESGGVPSFQLLGSAPQGLVLEASAGLGTNAAWNALTPPLPDAANPVLWDATTAPSQFYRVVPATLP